MGSYLGQNFLKDSTIRHRIAEKVRKMYHTLGATCLIEIGPGKGALTKLIKEISEDFVVIEKDELMKEVLEELGVKVVWGDVLEVEIKEEKTLIVGNLPYYITSPILRKFFGKGKVASDALMKRPYQQQGWMDEGPLGGLCMVQAEVGEKIKRDAQKKSYLYWLLNYGYHVEYLKSVPAKAFSPAPKVKSCLISLVKKAELPQLSFESLVEFLDLFAPYSRKTLGKIAKMVEKREGKSAFFSIPEDLAGKRLEELSWEELELILKAGS